MFVCHVDPSASAARAACCVNVAAHVAVLVSAEDVAFENEAAAAADALHDVNVATADRVAAETRAKAAEVAVAAREAAAAVRIPLPRVSTHHDTLPA